MKHSIEITTHPLGRDRVLRAEVCFDRGGVSVLAGGWVERGYYCIIDVVEEVSPGVRVRKLQGVRFLVKKAKRRSSAVLEDLARGMTNHPDFKRRFDMLKDRLMAQAPQPQCATT